MQRKEFENRIKSLLPKAADDVVESWAELWYAHMRGYQHVPVSGSFSEKRRDAAEYAKMYNGLPHKVEEIERKRREAFEKEREAFEKEMEKA